MNRIGFGPDHATENPFYHVNPVHPVKTSFFLATLRPCALALKMTLQ